MQGDVEALVRKDLKQLARLPDTYMRYLGIARTKARIASVQGDRGRAVELQRSLLRRSEESNMHLESAHDRYALGLLVGGVEGSQFVMAAAKTLSECGISDPDAYMRGYVPELMR